MRQSEWARVIAAAMGPAAEYLDSLPTRRVYRPVQDQDEIRAIVGGPLPEHGTAPEEVVASLARDVEPYITAHASGRFFGFVIGGLHPAAYGAELLTATWDQNAALFPVTPGVAVVEDVATGWLLDLLDLPSDSSVGLVTGGQMANFTCLAAARDHVLRARDPGRGPDRPIGPSERGQSTGRVRPPNGSRRKVMNRAWIGLCVAFALAATGCGGEPSLTAYVEQVNAAIDQGMSRYEVIIAGPEGRVLVAQGEELYDFTPQDLQAGLEQVAEIQDDIMAIVNDIEPPEQVAELHALFFRTLPVAELAARAGTAATWEELSESPEMAAYRDALVADQQTCAEFQTKLDATEQRGVFEDTPWIPGEFKEIVDAAIGCGVLPENPQDMYRPPPTR